MTEIKTNEEIYKEHYFSRYGTNVDNFVADWELEAMQESNEQAVRVALEMAAEKATIHSEYSAHIGRWVISVIKHSITSIHSQVMDKLKTPTK